MSILGIGQSALNVAQIGVATTGHNIANAATPGYSRQVVVQGSVGGQNSGFAFVGGGSQVMSVNRVYNEFLSGQVLSAQTTNSQLTTYSNQIKQIDNLLADQNAGLSPALQEFFGSVQGVSTDPNSSAARQAMLSSGESLAARFQSLSGQMTELRQGLNGQIAGSVSNINVYASQIANLNDAIEKAQAGGSKMANDLLDQRDLAVSGLSKEIKVSVVKQGESYNVFIGSGQPLVVGTKTTTMVARSSLADPSRIDVGVRSANGSTSLVDQKNLPGGTLGGLLEFRSKTLDVAQNTLGRVATNLAAVFNAQHELGQTQTGALGGKFFNAGLPDVSASTANNPASTAVMSATIADPAKLTISDYRVQVVAPVAPAATPGYRVTRLSDGLATSFDGPVAPATGVRLNVDGVDIDIEGTPFENDEFLVRPVVNGASGFSTAITNKADIALGAPVTTAATATNSGTGAISAARVNSTAVVAAPVNLTYVGGELTGFPANLPVTVTDLNTPPVSTTYPAGAPVPYNGGETLSFGGVTAVAGDALTPPAGTFSIPPPNATLTYDAANKTLSGFPVPLSIVVTANGASTTYAPGTAVPYTAGATISFGGVSMSLTGTPANGDTFKVGGNPNGLGDNRNALLLGKLQAANTLDGGTTTFQGAYSQLVSSVGNKSSELKITSGASASLLQQSIAVQQSESGVNLDEEAANLLRYQQAYQAAGKLIQTASTLFGVLLSLGN